jgi:hypothetical protein
MNVQMRVRVLGTFVTRSHPSEEKITLEIAAKVV